MSSTPTIGESEHDNSSSVNNISSLLAEKGTTEATGDDEDEIETSSIEIEALNWSEADEEEMQQQKTAAVKKTAKVSHRKTDKIEDNEFAVIIPPKKAKEAEAVRSEGDEVICSSNGGVLSSSLLQSISSTVDSDKSNKNAVIENWASNVKEAAERGEMEIADESADDLKGDEDEGEEDMTIDHDDNESNNESTGMRKRIRLSSPESPMSTSSFTLDSANDLLSNAPVLDDGPIWNKAPKRYRFQENRRINQKLTVGVFLAVILALGLGLGNLIAYNECETEYKTSVHQKSPESSQGEPENIISSQPSSETAENSVNQKPVLSPPTAQSKDVPILSENTENIIDELPKLSPAIPKTSEQEKANAEGLKPTKEDKSWSDMYATQMETLSKIVSTIDKIQMKIDKYENLSRHLGGVVLLPNTEDETTTTTDDDDGNLDTKPEAPFESPFDDDRFSILHENLDFMQKMFGEERNNDLAETFENVKKSLDAMEDETDRDNTDLLWGEVEDDESKGNPEQIGFSTFYKIFLKERSPSHLFKIIHAIEETPQYLKNQFSLEYEGSKWQEDDDHAEIDLSGRKGYEINEHYFTSLAYYKVVDKVDSAFIQKERDELREKKTLGLYEERSPEDYTTEELAEIKRKYEDFKKEYPFVDEMIKQKRIINKENGNNERDSLWSMEEDSEEDSSYPSWMDDMESIKLGPTSEKKKPQYKFNEVKSYKKSRKSHHYQKRRDNKEYKDIKSKVEKYFDYDDDDEHKRKRHLSNTNKEFEKDKRKRLGAEGLRNLGSDLWYDKEAKPDTKERYGNVLPGQAPRFKNQHKKAIDKVKETDDKKENTYNSKEKRRRRTNIRYEDWH